MLKAARVPAFSLALLDPARTGCKHWQNGRMRIDPHPAAPELESLAQYLDYQRETILAKTEGLTRAQLGRAHPPSDLTLAGLLLHLALVEEDWVEVRFSGMPEREPWAGIDCVADPNWEFRTAVDQDPEWLLERYRQACRRSRAALDGVGLEDLSVLPLRDGPRFTARWMLLHLIEETARHAGHADILREAIDGQTGE